MVRFGGAVTIDLPASTVSLIGIAAVFVGGLLALASFLIRRLLEARLPRDGGLLQDRLRIIIVALAVAESPAILGLVFALLSGTLAIPFVLWGCSFAACILHFPTRAWLGRLRDH